MIGYYGDIIFETSDEKILNLHELTHDSTARYSTHETIKEKPKLEFEGPGLDRIMFTVNLNGNHGVSVRNEFEKWREYVQKGEAYIFVIGDKPLGDDLWVVTSISNIWGAVTNDGVLLSGKIDVTLEEYISRL